MRIEHAATREQQVHNARMARVVRGTNRARAEHVRRAHEIRLSIEQLGDALEITADRRRNDLVDRRLHRRASYPSRNVIPMFSEWLAPGATVNAPGLCVKSPVKPTGSVTPCHGSMQMNGAPGFVQSPRKVASGNRTSIFAPCSVP